MSIIVTVGCVDTGERVYLSGESISGLSKGDEKELVDLGVCEYSEDEEVADVGNGNDLPEGLKKLGGGYYQLSDGSKVRGLPAALEALAKLEDSENKTNAPDEDDDKDEDDVDKSDADSDSDGPNTGLPGADDAQ